MPITQADFAAYLARSDWPRDASFQAIGRDVELMLNVILDTVATGTVKPRPPPRHPEEVLAFISWLVWTAQSERLAHTR